MRARACFRVWGPGFSCRLLIVKVFSCRLLIVKVRTPSGPKALEPRCSKAKRVAEVDSSCRHLIVPLFRGSSRFESLTSCALSPGFGCGVQGPPEALCGGISKVNFQETLSSFGDKCPQNGSKNGLRAPRTGLGCPHIGPSVVRVRNLRSRVYGLECMVSSLEFKG